MTKYEQGWNDSRKRPSECPYADVADRLEWLRGRREGEVARQYIEMLAE
jgi:ribosome modulation factor